ncbi:metallophosphoesterase family protein [Dethiothermospora halolimnae]|uniref:metallophosphoesterase family protein n=1 Tax=Dethiothermospora halolimnae TaxID=3114390 RepID=UPI003CCBAB8B
MKITFFHTGDLHLGLKFNNPRFSKSFRNNRRNELWDTFNNIVDRANKEKIDFLFITGDLYEEDYCNIGDIKRIKNKLKTLNKTKVILIAGNHDPLKDRSLYNLIEWPDNVYIIKNSSVNKLEFPQYNINIWGLSWNKKIERDNILDNIKIEDKSKVNILLAHGDTLSSKSEYLPIDINKLDSFDYVALGHIHKHQFITDNIVYCGSPEPLDFGETGAHGIIKGSISKEKLDLELIELNKRNYIIEKVEINENMDYEEIIDTIRSCSDKEVKNIFRIILTGFIDKDINLNIEDLERRFKNDFYYVEIINNTVLDYDLEKIERENKTNIIGHFIKEMKSMDTRDPIVKDALYEGLELLLKEKVIK